MLPHLRLLPGPAKDRGREGEHCGERCLCDPHRDPAEAEVEENGDTGSLSVEVSHLMYS